MLENRIKISSIIKNQLPDFVKEEFPLVNEFLSQYYLSIESKGSFLDILQNIDQYVKVDNLTNLIEYTYLTLDITFFDQSIPVESTAGFPDSYGLILIEDEIITYKSKTNTLFEGCVRGFNGITSYKNPTNTDQLVFTESNSSNHSQFIVNNSNTETKTKVTNLSILFLKEFFIKVKKQITPGLENREFYESLNENVFIKQSNNFYTSKGTEESFRILFGALYGSYPKLILPRDYLIQPSDAQYRINQNLVVESIEGNILDLINGTLYQDESNFSSSARGTISNIEKISRGGKIYYILSLDSGYDKDIDVFGSIKSQFKIHPKTIITNNINSEDTYIDVDSTLGFPNSGELIINLDLNFDGVEETQLIIKYTSKVLNQFLGCSGITVPINSGTEVKINNFVYGFNLNGETITARITGVISGIDSVGYTAYYEKGDDINIKTLGKDCKRVKENNWFFNIATYYDIKIIEDSDFLNTYNINLIDNHSFVIGDKVSIISSSSEEYSGKIIAIPDSKKVVVKTEVPIEINLVLVKYKIRKNISKFDSDDSSLRIYNTNIQNTYVDYDDSVYVTSPSLPSYLDQKIIINYFSHTFSDQFLEEDSQVLNIPNHSYRTGDSIVFKPSNSSDIEINGFKLTTPSIHFIKVENENNIKLSKSLENIFKEEFVTVTGNLNGSKLELYDFNDTQLNSLKLTPQNLIKKLSDPELVNTQQETDPGTIGIFVNGVELLNYKSTDKVFYGKIEEILVTSPGNNYDVINPPNLIIADSLGTNAISYCSVIGQLDRFDIIDPGFDYIEEPSILISGGNGSGAKARAKMISFEHSPEFSSEEVDIINNVIIFPEPHKFRNSEQVVYKTNNQKSVLGISTGSQYYVSVINSLSVKLYTNLSDSISQVNEVVFNEVGIGNHELVCLSIKKKISSVEVISQGSGYQNKKTTISGITTSSDILTIINHGYSDGEIITYYPESTPIIGLTSSTSYYVTKVTNNTIKLSEIGSEQFKNEFYKDRKYINFTSPSLSSKHYFNYPPITVSINGKVGISTIYGQDFFGEIVPVFRGKIQSVFVENGGVGYGSSDIINFNRQPNLFLISGSGCQLTPIILNGKIEKVIVQSPGFNYNSTPDVIITGDGSGAVLIPVISEGSIVEIKVIFGGFGYTKEKTIINVVSTGNEAKFECIIKSWRINLVEKYLLKDNISFDDGFIYTGLNELQYTHLYASRLLRSSTYSKVLNQNTQNYVVDLKLDSNFKEINSTHHSPIIGWAYDGNPIYGPYGYSTSNSGVITRLKSGYSLKELRVGGPDTDIYQLGFFVDDYEFTGNGDLDEYNGRYCLTPEFPDGTYAYFSTFSSVVPNSGSFRNYNLPAFPYVIGNYFKNKKIDFNFNQSSIINESEFIQNKLLRNTTPYNLVCDNSGYDYIFEPNKQKEQKFQVEFENLGNIESINVINPGDDYKVNENIIFTDDTVGGSIFRIKGKSISSITSTNISIDNIEFYPYDENNNFIGISTIPHNFFNNSLVTLTSKYEYKKSDRIKVLENTLTLVENVNSPSFTGIVTNFKVYGNLKFPVKENDFYQIGNEIIKILNIDSVNYKLTVLRNVFSIGTSHSIGSPLKSVSRKVIFNLNSGITTNFYNYKINEEYYFNPELSVGLGLTSGVGITTTLFLSVNNFKNPIIIEKGIETIIYFKNDLDIIKYSSGGYINITDALNVEYNTTKKRIIAIGSSSIVVDFNTSSFPGFNVEANLKKWNILNIPTKSIYLPNHKITTGDSLIYKSNQGSPISISTDALTSFDLNTDSIVYAVKISNDLIGISTLPVSIGIDGEISGIGTFNNIVYFSGLGTSNYHSFKTNYPNILTGTLSQNISTVSTSSTHGLQLNDSIYLDVESGISTTIKIIYNDVNRRLVIDPKVVESVNLTNNTLQITDHGFNTGEKLIYSTNTPIGGIVNNYMYYSVIIDSNNISLSNNLSDSIINPPNLINLTSNGTGTLSRINPELRIIKHQNIIFDVSDPSLSYRVGRSRKSAFDLKLYYDNNFQNYFAPFDLVKSGNIGVGTTSSITIKTKNLPNNFYYTLVPIDLDINLSTKKEIYIDRDQISYSKISLVDSEYYGKKIVTNLTSNTFTFNPLNKPEIDFYDDTTAIMSYETDSKNCFGPISKILVKNKEKLYKNLPKIKKINTNIGNNSILEISTNNIGSISNNNIKIADIGFNYSADYTIRPRCKLPDIIRVSPLYVFDSIEVISRGKNYNSAPNLIVLDGLTNEVVDDVFLEYNIDTNKIIILKNTKGINKVDPLIIPINNDNGVLINEISYDTLSKKVTVTLDGEFNDSLNFPFSVGDSVIIENISVVEGGKGYNSEEYDYKPFIIDYVDQKLGGIGATFSYSLDEFIEPGENPGIYDVRFSKGFAVSSKNFPKFSIKLKNVDFSLEETVFSANSIGIVKSWDSENNYLKVSTSDDFTIGDFIIGQTSKIKATIENIISFDAYLNIASNTTVNSGWKKQTGFLNNDQQRIYDSDYYQYFSYSIESEINFNKWNEVVSELNHTSGFKKFSDLLIEEFNDSIRMNESQNLGNYYSESISSEVINLNCVYDFDLVTENSFILKNNIKSNEIYFDSRILQDYIESIGNRVLIIDDISDKFTTSEAKKYQVIDSFELEDIRYKKYFIHMYDILDPTRTESLLVSLMHDGNDGFLNQYAVISSEDVLGYYDFQTELNRFGQLTFYPTQTERKIYKFNTFATSIADFVGVANTELNIGNIAKIQYVNQFVSNSVVSPISLSGVSTSRASYKVSVAISDKENSYYQYNEFSILRDNDRIITNDYGDLNNLNYFPNSISGIVTFASSIVDDDISIQLYPNSGVGVGTSFYVNAVITSIGTTQTTSGSLDIRGNILSSNFIQNSIGITPEPQLIFSHSNIYNSTYNNILIKDKTNNKFEFLEMNTLLNNSNQYSINVEYGILNNENSIGVFTSEISEINGDFQLYFTPYDNIEYEIKMLTTIIGISVDDGVTVI